MTWLRNVLVAFDQFVNAILGGNNPRETISSSVGRKARNGKRWAIAAEGVIDVFFAVFAGQRHHCERNIQN